MSNDLRNPIRQSMELKDTEELLEIWKNNNRTAWTDLAFDVVREILEERIGELPPQGKAIFTEQEIEQEKEAGSKEDTALDLDDWEAKLVDSENQPAFYDTVEVIELRRDINRMARIVVILSVLSGIFTHPTSQAIFKSYFPSNDQAIVVFVASIVLIAIGVGLNIVLTYYPLKALAHILRILMEMEYNSRR